MFKRIKKVSKRAELSMQEIADLCGVSRQTLYNWKDGAPSNRLIAERATKMVEAMEKATTLGYLPLAVPVDRARRMPAIKRAMTHALR